MSRLEAARHLSRLRENLRREVKRAERTRAAFLRMPRGWWPYAYAKTRGINKLLFQIQAIDLAIEYLTTDG